MDKKPERDFLYSQVIASFRGYVTDDCRAGLHLTRPDGETLDVVFFAKDLPELRATLEAVQREVDKRLKPLRE